MKNTKAIILFILLISTIHSYSQEIRYVNASAPAGGDGMFWNTAYNNLQEALLNVDATELWVAAGTYKPTAGGTGVRNYRFSLKSNFKIYGGFPGLPGQEGDFAVRDINTYKSILSGDIDNDGINNLGNVIHVIYNAAPLTNALLDGFTITMGYADGANYGGGIYFTGIGSSTTIKNCIIENNFSVNNGAGAYFYNSSPIIENCTFQNNTTSASGGAIYLRGSNAIITNCNIINNKSTNTTGGYGGGIYMSSVSNPVITGCDISSNVASRGGGIYATGAWTNSISSSTINSNSAYSTAANNGYGGGIYLTTGASTSITNCTLNANVAYTDINVANAGRGGALFLDAGSNVNMDLCTITYNIASTLSTGTDGGYGAGIYVYTSNPKITNSTISYNQAIAFTANANNARGGGIYVYNSNGTFSNNKITNNSVSCNNVSSSNAVGAGGGVYITSNAAYSPVFYKNQISDNIARFGGGMYINSGNTTAKIWENTISNNKANANMNSTGHGGGIYCNSSPSFISKNIIQNNIAEATTFSTSGYGGGIYYTVGSIPKDSLNMVSLNQANGLLANNSGYGGGYFIGNSCDVLINATTIFSNTASSYAGAVYLTGTSLGLYFNRCLLYSNTAYHGGAIAMAGTGSGATTPNFLNCIIRDNTAAQNGGAFFMNSSDPAKIRNNTIVNNSAGNFGGGFYLENDSDPDIKNCILWDNNATNGNQVYIFDNNSDPVITYSDVEGSNTAFGLGAGATYTIYGATNINLDPQFEDLVNYRIKNNSFSPFSPCIGKGDAATVIADFPSNQDYDGSTGVRIRGVIDIGAYETKNTPMFYIAPLTPLTDDPGPKAVTMDEDAAPTSFTLTLNAEDLDDDNVTWSVSTAASNGTASVSGTDATPVAGKVITYTPNANFYGTDVFVVQISDGTFSDYMTVNVTINSINDLPIFTSTEITTIKTAALYDYLMTASDVDNLPADLTFSCPTCPAWLSVVNNGNGTANLKGTAGESNVGINNVTIRVSDLSSNVDYSYTINVISSLYKVPSVYTKIQLAIDATTSAGDRIEIDNGIYNESIDLKGKDIEIFAKNGLGTVTLRGDGTASIVTFKSNEPSTTLLRDLIIENGTGSLLDLSSTSIYNNQTAYFGGGVLVLNANPTLQNVIIRNNRAANYNFVGGSGGGIYIGNNSNVTLNNVQIIGNIADTYRGAGICVDNSTVNIANSTITGNTGCNYGGGIGSFYSTVNINNTTINTNQANYLNGSGGGIFLIKSILNLNTVNMSGNSATKLGNGICRYSTSQSGTPTGTENMHIIN